MKPLHACPPSCKRLREAWLRDDEPSVRLHVLPPRRPRWRRRPAQGRGVERANRSARIEFRSLYDGPPAVADVAPRLARHEFFHNYRRPHWAASLPNPERVPCRDRGCRLIRQAKSSEMS